MAGIFELVTTISPKEAWDAHSVGRPIMLYFFTPDCGACKSFHGRMVAVTSPLTLAGDLTVIEMNYDYELPRILADKLNIIGFPAVAFFIDGEVRDIHVGSGTKREFQEWVDAMMATLKKESA